jgi:hypothetical protein
VVEKLDFKSRPVALDVAEENSEYVAESNDKRTTTVPFTDDIPASTLENLEAKAMALHAENDEPTLTQIELTEQEKRDLNFSRDGVSLVGARYLKGLGGEYGVDPFQHVDLAEIDAVADARPILERARRSGSSRGDQANYDDTAAERERRDRRRGAEKYASEECGRAEDYCEGGDEAACDYLVDECGLAREEAERMMGLSDEPITADTEQTELVTVGDGAESIDVTPEQAGTLRRSWQGYKGAVSEIEDALNTLRERTTDARRAMQAINGIRNQHGQRDTDPERLNELLAEADRIPASIPEPTRLNQHGSDGPSRADRLEAAADQPPMPMPDQGESIDKFGGDPETAADRFRDRLEADGFDAEEAAALAREYRDVKARDDLSARDAEAAILRANGLNLDLNEIGTREAAIDSRRMDARLNDEDGETIARDLERSRREAAAEAAGATGNDRVNRERAQQAAVREGDTFTTPEGNTFRVISAERGVADVAHTGSDYTSSIKTDRIRSMQSPPTPSKFGGDPETAADRFEQRRTAGTPTYDADPEAAFTADLRELADSYQYWRLSMEPEEPEGDSRKYARLIFEEPAERDGRTTRSKYGKVDILTHDGGSRTYQAKARLVHGKRRAALHGANDDKTSSSVVYDDEVANADRETVAETLADFFQHVADDPAGEPFVRPRVDMSSESIDKFGIRNDRDPDEFGPRGPDRFGRQFDHIDGGDDVGLIVDLYDGGKFGVNGFIQGTYSDQLNVMTLDNTVYLVVTGKATATVTRAPQDGPNEVIGTVDRIVTEPVPEGRFGRFSGNPDVAGDRFEQRRQAGQRAKDDGDGGTQFAAEKQGTLGVGVDPEETAEERQVTLTGDDPDDSSSRALPESWSGPDSQLIAGPYRIITEQGSRGMRVELWETTGSGQSFTVASGIRDKQTALDIAAEFSNRVAPDEVTFKSSDPTVQEAAAAAKKEVLE